MKQKIKDLLIGKKWLQPLFERLHRISLRGMNYGMAAYIESSGELFVLNLIKEHYKAQNIVIFDIGANNGQYLSYLLKYFGPENVIHSFEPSNKPFAKLSKFNRDNLYLHNFALSDEQGTADLFFDQEGTGWASMTERSYSHLGVTLSNKEKIEMTTIHDISKQYNVDKIHFCKLDIEGHELAALKGGDELISNNNIDFIQFEFGLAAIESKVSLKDFFDYLENYKIFRILQNGIQEIKYDERYEIYLNSNYLAINKQLNIS